MIKPKFGFYKAKVVEIDDNLGIKTVLKEYKWVGPEFLYQLYFKYKDEPNVTVMAEHMILNIKQGETNV